MHHVPNLGIVFAALAAIFVALAVRDFLNAEGKLTPARRTWLRIAIIFACVSIGLFVVQILSR
jgi:zinc transporter ZupT